MNDDGVAGDSATPHNEHVALKMSVRRVEDDARFHGGPRRGARLAVDDADARAVRRLVFDRKFVAQHPRGPHRQREVEHDDVVAR